MQNVTVLLLAAGFGTRLAGLTRDIPKPLVPVGEGRLIDCALWHCKRAGLSEIVVNLHYLGDLIKDYLGDGSAFGLSITYSDEDPILGTGGGVKKVLSRSPERSILVFNSDTVFDSSLDLSSFIESFERTKDKCIAGMMLIEQKGEVEQPEVAVVKDPLTDELLVSSILDCGSELRSPLGVIPARFTGIQILSPRSLGYMNKLGEVFSSTEDLYPAMLKGKERIRGEFYRGLWIDGGEKARLAEIRNAVMMGRVKALSGA